MNKEFCNFCGSNDMDKEELRPYLFGAISPSLGQICNYCFENYIN